MHRPPLLIGTAVWAAVTLAIFAYGLEPAGGHGVDIDLLKYHYVIMQGALCKIKSAN